MFEDIISRGLLRDIVLGNITDIIDTTILQSVFNTNTNPNTVMVITIDHYPIKMYKKSLEHRQELRSRVLRSLQKACKAADAMAVEIEEALYAVIFEAPGDFDKGVENSKKLGCHIKEYIKDTTGILVSVGIGRRYYEMRNLTKSYQEALVACKNKFYLGESQVIHWDDIIPYSKELVNISGEVKAQLTSKVFSCDKSVIELMVEDFFYTLITSTTHPVLLKAGITEILYDLLNLASNTGEGQKELCFLGLEFIEKIGYSDTLSELKDQMTTALMAIADELFEARKKANLDVYRKALDFIHENYHRSITLDDLAFHVHVSPHHLSRGFKGFSGMNFSEYLMKHRIEEAKRLLLTTDAPVGEVGRMVGYDDPNYFGRVFKNTVGIPPSNFRSSLA